MDFLKDRIGTIYFKYLGAAFGSALITSVYSIVDMAVVGQYQGPQGTAALAVVSPVWNLLYSLGLLMGIGGSVVFSTLRGESGQNSKRSNEYFTAALMGVIALGILSWILIIFFDKELLVLFGAKGELLTLARRYVVPVKFAVPSFLFTQMLAAFLRNDGAPGLATKAVLSGGLFNVFGDCFFVFGLKMGIFGAGLATAIGSVISLVIMLTHFRSSKNTLRLERPSHLLIMLREISVTGFSTFFIDVAMGILTMMFNRQIMKYLGTDALSVYGIIINLNTFVQCCAYSVGQASQPIISVKYGAGQGQRIREVLKYALGTAVFFGVVWTVLAESIPLVFVRIFMTPDAEILRIAPEIMGRYGLSFLLLPINIFSTYYFQALMKPGASFVVSVSRGMVISGALIFLLPVVAGADSLWFAMPVTELIVAVYVAVMMRKYTKALPDGDAGCAPKAGLKKESAAGSRA